MDNIKVTHDPKGKTLTLVIDLSKKGSPSKSGKTMLIASTGRNTEVAPKVYLGLNLYTYEGAPGEAAE